jgi:DNA-directed RNA polymerase specialized sigma24 family protein
VNDDQEIHLDDRFWCEANPELAGWAFVLRYRKGLMRWCRHHTGYPQAAQDMFDDVVLGRTVKIARKFKAYYGVPFVSFCFAQFRFYMRKEVARRKRRSEIATITLESDMRPDGIITERSNGLDAVPFKTNGHAAKIDVEAAIAFVAARDTDAGKVLRDYFVLGYDKSLIAARWQTDRANIQAIFQDGLAILKEWCDGEGIGNL